MAWFLGIVKGLFGAIDKVVVWLVEVVYNLILDVSKIQLFTNEDFSNFASRITLVLTIFMLFKLSFSFLTYIINPDSMTDKSKGFSKLIQNVAVALVLLVSYQFAFDKAMELQQKIIDNETIPKLILGNTAGSGNGVKNNRTISFALFSAFVQPNSLLKDGCSGYAFREIDRENNKLIAIANGRCDLSEYSIGVTGYTDMNGNAIAMVPNEILNSVVEHKDTNALFDHVIAWRKDEVYAFDYWFIISTACGVFAGLILLSFCIDIAVRTVKLAFLRLIAPIPIISYIDPIKGEGVFKKWLSNVGKTYADLFIRLIAIYFAIYVIQIVTKNLGTFRDLNGNPVDNPLLVVLIIIGALIFAKQFPKLIQDITGISFDSKLQLNPFKKISDEALGGKAVVGGMAALGAAGLAGATNFLHRTGAGLNNAIRNRNAGHFFGGLGQGVLSGIAGATSAGRRAFCHGMRGDGFVKSLWSGDQEAMFAKLQREDLQRQGSTLGGRIVADAARRVGVLNAGQREILRSGELDNQVKALEQNIDRRQQDLDQHQLVLDQKQQNINNLKQRQARHKEQHVEPLDRLMKNTAQLENIVDGDRRVKSAVSARDVAISQIESSFAVQNAIASRNKSLEIIEQQRKRLAQDDELARQESNPINVKPRKIDPQQAQQDGKQRKPLTVEDLPEKPKRLTQAEREELERSISSHQHNAETIVEETIGREKDRIWDNYIQERNAIANEIIAEDGAAAALVRQNEAYVDEILSNDTVTSGLGQLQIEKLQNSTTGDFASITSAKNGIKNYVDTFDSVDPTMRSYNEQIESEERDAEDIKNEIQDVRNSIQNIRNSIQDIKNTEEYIHVHNPKTAAKADNAARAIRNEQQEGWTPNPSTTDTRNYMGNSVGGAGPLGGTFPGDD